VGSAFGGEGAFHPGEQRPQQEGDPACALIRGADRQRVSQRAQPDAPPGQVVHKVEDLTQVTADPVEGVHDDRVAGPGVGEELAEAVAVGSSAGFLVGPGPLSGNARSAERIELAIQGLPGGGDAGVAEVEPPRRVLAGRMFHIQGSGTMAALVA
jgi:hypothetical protein